jgi:hypothetical protein
MTFLQELATQRRDDHRYYHHSRINQSLHLVSAISFLCAYAMLFKAPAAAAMIGWMFAMPSRQVGHFFFEPRGYDAVNHASHEHKEAIKVGYNLRRKAVLLTIWALSPLLLIWSPSLFGAFTPHTTISQFVHNVSLMWLTVGVAAVIVRTIQLFFLKSVQAGLVWFTKILTDPFHDIMLYYRSPAQLLRGELVDPMAARQTT